MTDVTAFLHFLVLCRWITVEASRVVEKTLKIYQLVLSFEFLPGIRRDLSQK
ncbi:hypothetical protein [Fictibacillus gelatini]|uniref:hypothetical protein n=1 Tax=Fictibacillus gelatini TaxID=225985 RepID=UPI0004032550|nr:hypothetical protein [Fictibacillus gelatini]